MISTELSFKRTLVSACVMLITMIFLSYINLSEAIKPNRPLASFPMQIGNWTGKTERFDEKVYRALGVDDSILSNYRTPNGDLIQLYVGFYQSQKEGDLIHSPKNCLPGCGWNIIDSSIEEVDVPETEYGRIKAIKLILEKGSQKQVVLYWFQSRGRIISSEYMQKIYLVVDSVTKRRTDGSFVRLISPVFNENQEKALNSLKDFAKALLPLLNEYIPS